jgi:hypothetical protein
MKHNKNYRAEYPNQHQEYILKWTDQYFNVGDHYYYVIHEHTIKHQTAFLSIKDLSVLESFKHQVHK